MKGLLWGLAVSCAIAGFWLANHNWVAAGLILLVIALFAQGTVVAMYVRGVINMEREMNDRH